MKNKATVISTDGEFAVVEVVRLSACEGCHKAESGSCSVCTLAGGGAKKVSVRAHNPIGAEAGETVVVESSSRRMLLYAACLFLLPLLLFAAGLGIAELFHAAFCVRVLAGFCGLLLAYIGVLIFEKTVAAKHCDVTIVTRLQASSEETPKTDD